MLDEEFIAGFCEMYIGAIMSIEVDIISKESRRRVIILHKRPLRIVNVCSGSWRVVRYLLGEITDGLSEPGVDKLEGFSQDRVKVDF